MRPDTPIVYQGVDSFKGAGSTRVVKPKTQPTRRCAREVKIGCSDEVIPFPHLKFQCCSEREDPSRLRIATVGGGTVYPDDRYGELPTRPNSATGLLVAIVFGFVRSLDGNTDVVCLSLGHLGQLDTKLFEVQTGNFFVKRFGKHVDPNGKLSGIFP